MRRKIQRWAGVAAVCSAGILICVLLYWFVDRIMNGFLLDWFEKNYMVDLQGYYPYDLIRQPNWPRLKGLLFWIFTVNMIFWILLVFLAMYVHGKKKIRECITFTSHSIHDYMDSDKEASVLFPAQYAEVSAQMAEIKSTMQRHEQILKEEAARKNDLITYLAHDLKTPLTSVIGYLSLLDEAPELPENLRAKYVHITLDKAQRLEKLINEFFDITRYNLQHIELEEETIDLSYMLIQMTDEFYPVLKKHGNIAKLCMAENIMIRGDAVRLARVFNNILKNAVAYSYPDTEIKIWAEQAGDEVKIYFQNQGKNIPVHKLESIFEKFFRLDDARASNTGGAGLGLAIAKEIILLHRGTITADSKNETTTFCVSLPYINETSILS